MNDKKLEMMKKRELRSIIRTIALAIEYPEDSQCAQDRLDDLKDLLIDHKLMPRFDKDGEIECDKCVSRRVDELLGGCDAASRAYYTDDI